MECQLLRLINFCQHSDLTVQFTPGLNGIIGPNGSGKSNIINAIRFAITGINFNEGTKSDNIRTDAPKRAPAKVILEFTHSGHTYVIDRNLRSTKPDSTLMRDGEIIAEKSDSVTAKLFEILGVSIDLFNDVVASGQDDIYGFIALKAAKRAEQFQTLFRTQIAEHVHTEAGNWLKKNPVSDHSEQLRTTESNRDRLAGEIAEKFGQRNQLPPAEECQAIVDRAQAASEYTGRLAGARDSLRQAQEQFGRFATFRLDEMSNQLAQMSQALNITDADIAQRRTKEVEMRSAITTAENAAKHNGLIKQSLGVLADFERDLTAIPYFEEAAVTTASTTLTLAQADRNKFNHLRTTLDGQISALSEDGKCPTCGVVSESSKLLRQQLTEQRDQVLVSEREAEQAVIDATSIWTAMSNNRTRWLQVQDNIARQRNWITSLGEWRVVPSAQEAETFVKTLETLVSGRNLAASQITTLNNTYQVQRTQYDMAVSQVNQAGSVLAELESNPAAAADDPLVVQAAKDTLAQHSHLTSEIGVMTNELRIVEGHLANLRSIVQTEEKELKWRAIMDGVRQFTHRTGLPAMVASRNMKIIQDEMNRFLSVFATDFRINSDNGVDFTARFFSHKEQPVGRLSGGQKVVTALSFKLAVNRLLASHVGLLILDEPTVYQDEQNIQAFAPTLDRLRQFSAARGLQCIIVTHEKELAGHCSNVVQIS